MSENSKFKEPLNKNNKVPKLRFPEFKDDWKLTLIEDICTNEKYSFTGGPFGSNLKVSDYTKSGVRVIQLNNINDIYFNDDNKVFVSIKKADSLKSCNAYSGDLIFAKMMPAGRLCILPKTYDRYLLGSDAIRLKPNIDKYYCFFLLECLNRTIIRNSITSKTSGSTRHRIGLLDLKKTSFYCPNYAEQKRIGLFFELIESKISIISKKIDILKKYKKGMFLDTRKCSKKIALKNILSEVNIKTKYNNQYEILSSTAVGLFSQKEYFKHQVASENNVGYKVIKKGQLLFSPQNLWLGNINLNNDFKIGMVSPSYKIYDIDNSINSTWLISMLKSQNMLYKYKQISEQGASVVRRNLDLSQFLEITLDIPVNQIQIGITLETIDKKINALSNLLINLKNLKMHFLNEMFI